MALRPSREINAYRGNRIQTGPAVEPISIDELKTHLRLSGTAEDPYLSELIEAARQEIEDASGIAMISQDWRLTLDRWPGVREEWWDGEREGHIDEIYGADRGRYGSVRIPRFPLLLISEIRVYGEESEEVVVDLGSVFDVDTQQLRGRITIKRGATWPIALRANNAIEIDYSAGYGETPATVPAPLRRAVRQMAAFFYEHRGDGCQPGDAFRLSGAQQILDRYRDVSL